jgi:hypothetical protein
LYKQTPITQLIQKYNNGTIFDEIYNILEKKYNGKYEYINIKNLSDH